MKHDPRLWLIELLLYWEGRINTRPLQEVFGLSRQRSSALIQAYRDANGDNLDYDPRQKAYSVMAAFRPQYIDLSVDQYLNWLCHRTYPEPYSEPSLFLAPTQITPPKRYVSPLVMRKLVHAIKHRRKLEADYLSVTSSDPSGRLFSPHSFVKTATRWHVRGYCEKRQTFLDLVLSRFKGEPEIEGPADFTEADDSAWNTLIDIQLAPDPRLNPVQQQVIIDDYGMQDGRLTLPTRAALVHYTLDDLQVKTKMWESRPEAQQLVCVNLDDIRPWLFG